MRKQLVVGSLVVLGLLALLVPGLGMAEDPTPATQDPSKPQTAVPETQAGVCTAAGEKAGDAVATDQAANEADWDPATCGTCQGYCSSDDLCRGKLLGDRCDNNVNSKICRAFSGCALFNCCYCG